jgi:hypothetical protein
MEEFMKMVCRILVSLSVLTMIVSCTSTYENKGDSAYKLAQKLQGDQKRYQQKMAYLMYDKAIKAHPNRVSPKLRNHYVEMILLRAGMVLNEGAAGSEALPLFMRDLDSAMSGDVAPELKQQYALFLTQLADSSIGKERFIDALDIFDKAIEVANDKAPIDAKKRELLGKIAKDNYDVAEIEMANAKANKDVEGFIKAEYYTLVSMLYDSTNVDTKKMISDLRKENKNTYSAYVRVVTDIPDSAIFRKVNKWDILLAVPTYSAKGGSATAVVTIYNNSWNPLRMNSGDFKLVDVNGRVYPASQTRLEPEMLDQEHETKCKLTFPGASGEIKKLIYENGEHFTEKNFM